jgi:hypothetical protein
MVAQLIIIIAVAVGACGTCAWMPLASQPRQGQSRQGQSRQGLKRLHSEPLLTPAQQSLEAYVERIRQEMGDTMDTDEGRACMGEPSVDPSKLLNPNQGDSEWVDDW